MDLYEKALFNEEFASLEWDDADSCWEVKTSCGPSDHERFFIITGGILQRPSCLLFPGFQLSRDQVSYK
jgi:hypothetical protein